MIKKETINGKIFIKQTTYYVYKNKNDLKNNKSEIITSDKKIFKNYKKKWIIQKNI